MDSEINQWSNSCDQIQGLGEHILAYGYGGDPYLHAHYDRQVGVCAYNLTVKETVPQSLVDQLPLFFNAEPVMVIFCTLDERKYWKEVKRRLHTGEVMTTPENWLQYIDVAREKVVK